MNKIEITNTKIINFYETHKEIDIERMNLFLIDLYNNFMSELTGPITKSLSYEILTKLTMQSKEIEQFKNDLNSILKSDIDIYKHNNEIYQRNNEIRYTSVLSEVTSLKDITLKLNNDITNNVLTKMYDIQNSLLENIKLTTNNTSITSSQKIIENIEKENIKLISSTSSLLSTLIPESQNKYYENHKNYIKTLETDIKNNIHEIKKEISIDKMELLLKSHYSNFIEKVQNNILQYINSSEERIKKDLTLIKESDIKTKLEQENINQNLQKLINNNSNSSIKGKISENQLYNLINNIYPSGTITNTCNETSMGDILLQRKNKTDIILENKNYEIVVPTREVDKFIYDCKKQNKCGIMISQKSGISMKYNYEIDIYDDIILIYIHNMNYNSEHIIVACDIIDNLYEKLILIKKNIGTINIDEETLIKINDEYQIFINNQQILINQLQEQTKNNILLIKKLELPNITSLLLTKFTVKNNKYKCKDCDYIAFSNRGLCNHRRTCKTNNKIINNISDDMSDKNSDDISDIKINSDDMSDIKINSDNISDKNIDDIHNYIKNNYNQTQDYINDKIKIKILYSEFKKYSINNKIQITYKFFIDSLKIKYNNYILHNNEKTYEFIGLKKLI
jgi:hypothetical protein